ncbi:MAG: hypothetical protein WCA41_16070 [Candidatus Acidiferrum sp.]
MADELAVLKERLLDSIRREGFALYYGAFPGDNLPQLAWNLELAPDPDQFLQAAKLQNVRLLYVNWVVFTRDAIDDNVLQATEGRELTGPQTDWLNDHNNRLEEFREYAGQTASVKIGFLLDGVFHFFERVHDWYESFGALIDEEMPEA